MTLLVRAWVLALELELEFEFGVVRVLQRVFAFEFVLLCVLGPRRFRTRPPPYLNSSARTRVLQLSLACSLVLVSPFALVLLLARSCTSVCTLTRTCARHRTGTGRSTCSHSLSCSRFVLSFVVLLVLLLVLLRVLSLELVCALVLPVVVVLTRLFQAPRCSHVRKQNGAQ